MFVGLRYWENWIFVYFLVGEMEVGVILMGNYLVMIFRVIFLKMYVFCGLVILVLGIDLIEIIVVFYIWFDGF